MSKYKEKEPVSRHNLNELMEAKKWRIPQVVTRAKEIDQKHAITYDRFYAILNYKTPINTAELFQLKKIFGVSGLCDILVGNDCKKECNTNN